MARALWSGSLSFGLVNVPVQLVSAVRDLDFHFRQLHEKDKAPIEQRRYCAEEDVEVTWEEVAHSYDLDGKQVVVTDEELASVQPRKTRTIDIEGFVDLADVDPIFFDHPYLLVPAGESEGTRRAYRLLVEAMGSTDRAVAVIEELSTDWDPGRYEDCYRERLRRVIEDKRKRRKIEAPEPTRQPAPAEDLMEALERTLEEVRSG